MKLLLKRRADQAIANASSLLSTYNATANDACQSKMIDAVNKRLNPGIVVIRENNLMVTEMGFVTMALLTSHAELRKDLLLIPGVDEKNQFGYLVLRDGFAPYHSLARDSIAAVADAESAHDKSAQLVDYFGSKAALKKAVNQVSWFMLSTLEDARAAGLCEWGTISFLRRTGLVRLGRNPTLPRFMLRLAGGYGDRITAASIRRLDIKSSTHRLAMPQRSAGVTRNHNAP